MLIIAFIAAAQTMDLVVAILSRKIIFTNMVMVTENVYGVVSKVYPGLDVLIVRTISIICDITNILSDLY
jgi:hypothetical protein